MIDPALIKKAVREALKEDIGRGDVTTEILFPKKINTRAVIQAKQEGIIAGLQVVRTVFKQVDPRLRCRPAVRDGERVKPGAAIASLSGDGRSILMGERVALNFLQHLSGIATLTARFVKAAEGTQAKILDTRKTMPGLRMLEKYAVRIGGGRNHRMNLSERILIKDNHIALAGDLGKIVRLAKKKAGRLKVEVEVTDLSEIQEAVSGGAEIILLDNMTVSQLKQAVTQIKGRALIEASGGIHIGNVREIASTGVDFISIGALTHSAPALDFSLEFIHG